MNNIQQYKKWIIDANNAIERLNYRTNLENLMVPDPLNRTEKINLRRWTAWALDELRSGDVTLVAEDALRVIGLIDSWLLRANEYVRVLSQRNVFVNEILEEHNRTQKKIEDLKKSIASQQEKLEKYRAEIEKLSNIAPEMLKKINDGVTIFCSEARKNILDHILKFEKKVAKLQPQLKKELVEFVDAEVFNYLRVALENLEQSLRIGKTIFESIRMDIEEIEKDEDEES